MPHAYAGLPRGRNRAQLDNPDIRGQLMAWANQPNLAKPKPRELDQQDNKRQDTPRPSADSVENRQALIPGGIRIPRQARQRLTDNPGSRVLRSRGQATTKVRNLLSVV